MNKKFNPVTLQLDMPVRYIPETNEGKSEVLTGHYAYADKDGKHYVWKSGGTSYTRAFALRDSPYSQDTVVACEYVFPMDMSCHSHHKHLIAQDIWDTNVVDV